MFSDACMDLQQLKEYQLELEKQMSEMEIEFKKRVNNIPHDSLLTEAKKQSIMMEIQMLEKRIQTFQENAQKELELKQQELSLPIMAKAQQAIKKVAAANGYEYVIDSSIGSLVVSPESKDIIKLVEVELGL